MGRPILVAAALAIELVLSLGGLASTPLAGADTSDMDRQFLATLESSGLKISNPAQLTSLGHMVCNEGLAHGVSVQEMRTTLMSSGYSSRDASALIDNAIRVYCPKYAAAGSGPNPAAQGDDPSDTFADILKRQYGIAVDNETAADIADVACNSPTQGVGLYNAQQALAQRHPEINRTNPNAVGLAMGAAVLAFCQDRLP